MSLIRVSAVVLTDGDGRILLVRKAGSRGSCCRTEVGAELDPEGLMHLGRITADAAKEGHRVDAEVFLHRATEGLARAGEIEEPRWLDPATDAVLLEVWVAAP